MCEMNSGLTLILEHKLTSCPRRFGDPVVSIRI